jgi:hypothetical protein
MANLEDQEPGGEDAHLPKKMLMGRENEHLENVLKKVCSHKTLTRGGPTIWKKVLISLSLSTFFRF